MSDIINQNTEPLFIFDMPDDETLSETISVKGEKGEKGDPTKLSDLENDEGFITNAADDLANYYDKTTTDTELAKKLDKTTFNAYEIPSDFFTGSETISGTGSAIALSNTAEATFISVGFYGNTVQDGTPTPDNPVPIEVVTGEQTIAITGDGSQTFTLNLGDIELCKNGNYTDYIYKGDDGWYLHKEINKKIFTPADTHTVNVAQTNTARIAFSGGVYDQPPQTYSVGLGFSNMATGASSSGWNADVVGFSWASNGNVWWKFAKSIVGSTSDDVEAWLTGKVFVLYYPLATADETLITDATLIEQLEALLRAKSNKGTTVVTITGSLPIVLSIEAYSGNWDGTTSGLASDIAAVNDRLAPATDSDLGLVKAGDGLNVDADGKLSMAEFMDFLPLDYKTVRFAGTGGESTVCYSIIPKEYKPDLTLANGTIDNVEDPAKNAMENKSTITTNAGLLDVETGLTRGIVIKDGVTIRANDYTSDNKEIIYMLEDGTLNSIAANTPTAQVEALHPKWAVMSFYPYVKNGVDLTGQRSVDDYQPRTFIGQDAEGNYIIGVCGGRDYLEAGMTARDVYNFVNSVGFTPYFLYNLDGGGSSVFVYKGIRVNKMVDYENREVSSFITFKSDTAKSTGVFEAANAVNRKLLADEKQSDVIKTLRKADIQALAISGITIDTASEVRCTNGLIVVNIDFSVGSDGIAAYSNLITGLPPHGVSSGNLYFMGMKQAEGSNDSNNMVVQFYVMPDGKIRNRYPLSEGKYNFNITYGTDIIG